MNYLIMRVGKTIAFNPMKWSSQGGDNEPPTIIKVLSYYNPNDNFIVCSYSDVLKCSTINSNIKYVYINEPKVKNLCEVDGDMIIQGLKRIGINQIDGVLVFTGITGTRNDVFLKKNKSLNFILRYCRPIFNFLNQTKCKYICFSYDPRLNFLNCRDLFNTPKKIFSQYDESASFFVWDNGKDKNIIQLEDAEVVYSGIEKTYLIGKKKPNITDFNKTEKFNIILNEGISRFKTVKKYIIDNLTEYKIYGNWKHPDMLKNPNFKGPVPFVETQNILQKTKYTLIIPILDGYVTSKYVEMIQNCVIPFFSDSYDTQKHVNVPEFLRIKDGKELKEKIDMLENDKTLYNNILNELLQLFDDDDYSGKRINNLIMNEFKKLNYKLKI